MIILSSDTDKHTVKQRRLTDLLCILCMQIPNQVLKVTHHNIGLKYTKMHVPQCVIHRIIEYGPLIRLV